MRRFSRHLIALVLLAAAATLVTTPVMCVVSCLGVDVAGGTVVVATTACHDGGRATDDTRLGAVVDCRDDHSISPSPSLTQQGIPTPATAMSVGVRLEPLLVHGRGAASVLLREGSPPTGPPLRI